jgi:uncharacterized protein YcfJ
MKKLAMLAVAVALITFAPRDAAAQGSQSTSIGAVFPTLLGACTGGAIGYYFVTGPLATFVGAVAGGAVGNWWYSASTAPTPAPARKKLSYSETLPPVLQLIGYDTKSAAGLRTAAFSAASD